MSQADARAWWADVEHLRERMERRHEVEHVGGDDEGRARHAATGRARRAPVSYEGSASTRHDGSAATRRTVRIRGQAIPTVTAPRLHVVEEDSDQAILDEAWHGSEPAAPTPRRRRPAPRAADRVGDHPDRIAMWAVILGFVMVLAAILSAHGL